MSGWAGWGRTILGSLAIAASAVAVGFVHSGISPEGVGLTQHPLEAVSELDSSRFLNSLEETRAKWEAGITFIDARAEGLLLVRGAYPGSDLIAGHGVRHRVPEGEGQVAAAR